MNFALGKREAKRDRRNMKFRAIIPRKLPAPPPIFDVDFDRPDQIWPLPLPMFGNDQWGDCVIAARANFTLRMEKLEQGVPLPITDDDVLREYWREQGGDEKSRPDEGLVVLDSLKSWRSEGWQVASNRYNIYAFAEIDRHQELEAMQAIYLLNGAVCGVMLRQGDMDALDRKTIWSLPDSGGEIVGGHCMYLIGYTRTGPVFLTWGQRMVATWEWFLSRCDEIYGVVDDRNKFMQSPLKVEEMDAILKEITKA